MAEGKSTEELKWRPRRNEAPQLSPRGLLSLLSQTVQDHLPTQGQHPLPPPPLQGSPTSITSQGIAPADLSLQASLMEVVS